MEPLLFDNASPNIPLLYLAMLGLLCGWFLAGRRAHRHGSEALMAAGATVGAMLMANQIGYAQVSKLLGLIAVVMGAYALVRAVRRS